MLSKIIFKNTINLTLINGVNLLAPLILIPLIIAKFSTKVYGEFVFFNSIFILLAFITNLGTTQSALILVNKYNKNLTEVYSSVLTIKFIVITILLTLYFSIIYLEPKLIPSFEFYYAYIIIFDFLLSDWVYYYKNKLQIITYINSFNKLLPILLLVLLNGYINSFSIFLFFLLISAIITGLTSFIYLHKTHLRFEFQSFSTLSRNFKIIISFYWVFILGKLRLSINKILLGILNFEVVAFYDIAEKIKNICILPSHILVDATFSTHSKEFDYKLFKKTMMLILASSIMLLLFSLFLIQSEFFIEKIKVENIFNILLLFSFVGLLQTVNYQIQRSFLLAQSKSRILNIASIYGSLSFIIIISVLIYFDIISIYYLIINILISDLIALITYYKYNS